MPKSPAAQAGVEDKQPERQPAPFLSKTWSLLEDPANSHLISWTADGDAFMVLQPDAFARELLPTVFKHNNFSSFVRQLNIYGFRKLPSSQQEFCHQWFKRDQPHLLSQICRGSMPSANSDGPQAELASLKLQVDKLTKALSYSLAELHRRGFDALIFDWKELAFVDPSGFTGGAVASRPDAKPLPLPRKRSAQSGSMMYLQNTVQDAKLKGAANANAEGTVAKVPRLEESAVAGTAHDATASGLNMEYPMVPPPQASTGTAGLDAHVPQPLPSVLPAPVPEQAPEGQTLSMLAEAASRVHPQAAQPTQPQAALPLQPPEGSQNLQYVPPPTLYQTVATPEAFAPAAAAQSGPGHDVTHAQGVSALELQAVGDAEVGAGDAAPTRDDSMMAQQGSLPVPQST